MKEKETNYVKERIAENHKKAGIPKIKGDTALEKALNKNRLKAGLEQK